MGLVAVDVIVFDVVTEEVDVATPGSNDVADELWLCVVPEEVVVATPGADDVADELWLCVVTDSEVVVATTGADDVADELWLCVVTDSEVVVVTPGTDNDVLMPRVVVLVALVVHGMEAGLFRLKIISSFNDIILFNVPAS